MTIANLEAIIDMAKTERPEIDDAYVKAAEIMGIMLREGDNLATQRKIAAELWAFVNAHTNALLGFGS